MATTFHLFPFLPWELRARIWELTVEPRTVHVHAKRYYLETNKNLETAPSSQQAYARLVSTTPVPATLQTCRESRNLGLYQKGLSEVEVVPEGGESRYIWLNFDIDMIDYGRDDLFNYRRAAQSVKRLKYSSRKFLYRDVQVFNLFEHLIEAYFDCFDEYGLGEWYNAFAPFVLSCDRRNIHLIQSENNRTTTAQELEEEVQRREQEDLAEFANLDQVPVSEMLAGLNIDSLMPTIQHIAEIARNMEYND